MADPAIATAEFARSIVADYIAWYQQNDPGSTCTQAAMDRWPGLESCRAARRIRGRLTSAMTDVYRDIWKAQRKATRFWHNALGHLGHFCQEFGKISQAADINGAAHDVFAALEPGNGRFLAAESHHGAKVQQCRGVTIYLVPPITEISRYYRELDFAGNHPWIGMLDAYHDC